MSETTADKGTISRCSCSYQHQPHDFCDGNPGATFANGLAPPRPDTPAGEATPGVDINDDVFDYDGPNGVKQCISGFGENTLRAIRTMMRTVFEERRLDNDEFDGLAWNIRELVRWCRGLNRKAQESAAHVAALTADRDRLQQERDALAAFKAYVHKRLDDAGVPVDPDSPHKAQGCRVGGRLDWLLVAFANVQIMQADLAEAHRVIEKAGLEKSADGVWLVDCEKLYCPQCGYECRPGIGFSPALCDNCDNPDDHNEPPCPWFESWCYSSREAALAAIAKGIKPGEHSRPAPPAGDTKGTRGDDC